MKPRVKSFALFFSWLPKAHGRNANKSARNFHNLAPHFFPPQKSTRIDACGVLPKIIAHKTRRPRPSASRAFLSKIINFQNQAGAATAKKEKQTG